MRRAHHFALLALLLLVIAPPAGATTVENDLIRLGVNASGSLNSPGTDDVLYGVFHKPSAKDGTRGGCPCEGWGAGAIVPGSPPFQGRANESLGDENIAPVSFDVTPTTARSVVDVLNGAGAGLRVTQDYHPSPSTPNLFEITITLENVSGGPLDNVRYERVMDWDIEPTQTNEFVTINRGSPPPDLFYSDNNGFSDNLPFTFGAEGDGPESAVSYDPNASVNASYVDLGPDDHGARFTFDFGSLPAGGSKTFSMYYGAAASQTEADNAVSAAALEMFSYGQSNASGLPNETTEPTFIWGFRGVGGRAVFSPTVTLAPKTASVPRGSAHTVNATLRNASGSPIPGAKILFEVTGANSGGGSATSDGNGSASFSWTGANAGDDTVKACLDANNDNACGASEVVDTAQATWTAPITPREEAATAALDGSATELVGDKHSVTVAGRRGTALLANVPVVWRVTGPNPTTGRATTAANGNAKISWTGKKAGTDTLAVLLDLNGNGNPDAGEPVAAHTVEWLDPPVVGKTANVEPVSGTVLVKLPKGANAKKLGFGANASKGFIPLTEATTIPLGSIMDTTKGRVAVQTAATISKPGQVQGAQFYDGQFKITQTGPKKKPVTELVMNDPLTCKASRQDKVTAAAARSRRLWGNGKGRFRTRGRHSSATVRGTVWLTKDTCTTTTTTVRRGTVIVRDFAKRKNVTVKQGKKYVARQAKKKK